MVHGLDHPRGPLERADAIDPAQVLAVVRGLHEEIGDDRYGAASLLARSVRTQTRLRSG